MPGPELAPFTTVFRASSPNRIKRNRQAVSCTACQKRKTRCDRRSPCGACEKRGEEATCRLGSAQTAASQASGAPVTSEVQNRLARLEEMVRGLAPPDRGDLPRDDIQRRDDGVNYHGPTSWAALVESIHDIQSILQGDDSPSLEPSDPSGEEDPDAVFGSVGGITLDEIVSSLPARQDADRLVQAFLNAKFIALPFIHSHQFRRQYDAFWADPSSTSILWVSILFSFLSAGSAVARIKGFTMIAPRTDNDSAFYMAIAARCLVTGDYLRAPPMSVEALTIHANSRWLQRIDSSPSVWVIYSLAVRLAQRRGYHRDPARISAKITPFEAEMRRRTWFTIQSLDLLFSFQHGLPPMIDWETCDVGEPTNLDDDDFDEDAVLLPPARPPVDPAPIHAYIVKNRLCHILRRILRHALKVEPPSYTETLELDSALDVYYENVPACFRARRIRSSSFTDPNYTIMHRFMLDQMYHKARTLLHRPYLSASQDDPRFALSREKCRQSAQNLVGLHIEFDEEMQPGGRLYEDRHMITSLTLHDFLMASTIMCVDLSEPRNTGPERADRIKLLHRAHGILKRRGTESRDVRHAAAVLQAILHKVDSPAAAGSTLGSTLANTSDTMWPTSTAPTTTMETNVTVAPGQNMYPTHLDFDALPQLDIAHGTHHLLDWGLIDNCLRVDSHPIFTPWDGFLPNVEHQ